MEDQSGNLSASWTARASPVGLFVGVGAVQVSCMVHDKGQSLLLEHRLNLAVHQLFYTIIL